MNAPRNRSRRVSVELDSEEASHQVAPSSAEVDERMRQLLDQARQNVARLVKSEAGAELVTEDVLSFRLGGH
jgi:hypothetical protein